MHFGNFKAHFVYSFLSILSYFGEEFFKIFLLLTP